MLKADRYFLLLAFKKLHLKLKPNIAYLYMGKH